MAYTEITSARTTAEIEALRGTLYPVRSEPGAHTIGDGVTVTSTDGDKFIGSIIALDDDGTDDCRMSAHIHVNLI